MSEEEKVNKPRFITGETCPSVDIIEPAKKEKDKRDKEDETNNNSK